MPEGVVQWIDPASGRATVLRDGHVYAAAWNDIESAARRAGVRVHFDVHREGGAERAVRVQLHPEARGSSHRHRVGSLAGARRPDARGATPFAARHPERGRVLATHPLEVARAWADCLQSRDIDAALSLYSSDAVLHGEDGDHAGRAGLGRYLEASPMFGIHDVPHLRGADGSVVVQWPTAGDGGIEVRSRVEHGVVAEQWVGRPSDEGRTVAVDTGAAPVEFAVVTRGAISESDVDHAMERVRAVVGRVHEPILFARLKLSVAADPAQVKPALAQVTIDVDGELVRAHVAGHTVREAADLLQRRLNDQLEQRAQHREALRTRPAGHQAGQWRHGDRPDERPDHFDRPPDQRQLVRHKMFEINELTVDEAAFDMEQLDYDFHLFRDLASGDDSVLERLPGGGYRLNPLHPVPHDTSPTAISLTVTETAAPQFAVSEAIERLDSGGERFVFFADSATGRGNVVYRRYDGHYGLIVPE